MMSATLVMPANPSMPAAYRVAASFRLRSRVEDVAEGLQPERSSRRHDADHLARRASVYYGGKSGRPTVLRSSASESLHGTIWRRVDCGLRLQSGLAGDLRAGAHEPAYRSRSTCADYRAYWEYGGARLGCQADHRSPVKRPQPRRSTIKLRRAASGAGLCLHAAVRGPVAWRAFLPEGTFRAMDTPPPYFARRRSPVAGPSSVS